MIYLGLIAGIIGGDALIKRSVMDKELEGEDRWNLPHGIEIHRMENDGAAAGLFSEQKTMVKAANGAVVFTTALALLCERRRKKHSLAGIAMAMIVGGGLSNLLDRVRKGTVTDYVRFTKCPVKPVRHLVFNISDFFILIGGFVLSLWEVFPHHNR